MRCLTLARAAVKLGHEAVFFVADIDAVLEKKVTIEGIRIVRLSFEPDDALTAIEDEYEPDRQKKDVDYFLSASAHYRIDWVVVDHYGYGEYWVAAVKSAGYRVLLIEDWPHRKVSADLLLDARPGATVADYADYFSSENILCGSEFNLIREEFFSEPCRPSAKTVRVLVNLGGYDYRGLTADILDQLAKESFCHPLNFTVLLSRSSPAFSRVKEAQYPFSVKLIDHCDDMAGLYRSHDACIGASGGSLWERVAIQLRTALVIVAENQRRQASYAEDMGLVKIVADYAIDSGGFDSSAFRDFVASHEIRQRMQTNSCRLLEKSGSPRIIEALQTAKPKGVTLRVATLSDMHDFYCWQTQPGARRFFRSPQLPRWSQHRAWYQRVMSDPATQLFIICVDGASAGYLRLDGSEVSILISREFRGRKLAGRALEILTRRYPDTRFVADVAVGNFASRKVFKRAGFRKTGERSYEY
jgi:UDP-2,4-diacetamido-2,4,6-trideoxy-beta-L-altropyranose hydrolase